MMKPMDFIFKQPHVHSHICMSRAGTSGQCSSGTKQFSTLAACISNEECLSFFTIPTGVFFIPNHTKRVGVPGNEKV